MYLSIGSDFAVRQKSIIGIFDLDNCSYGKHTRGFLARAEQQGEVVTISPDLPKSFVLTEEFGMNRVYLTQFGSSVLEKRYR
ncbi:MAG: DUF370 domain-containing protein [Oscillospiraceae bacterium]|nr:DUF370 domain-containing protein [Oscillospiraceae bacterium]